MERIKQAIEKVKKQRRSRTGHHLHSTMESGRVTSASYSQADEELGEVNYEHTRVVKLQAEHLEKNRIISFNKNDPMSMHFDLLRTHVLQKMEEKGWRTLAITSPAPAAGKTVLAINLAMSIAQLASKSAMLVDFDLRRPKVGTYLGIPMEKSWNDLLDGTAEISDVLINPDMPRLVVLATKTPVKKSAEMLSSKKIADLIHDLRERYASRIVIFDLPPLLVSDDVIALMPQIDCVLLVVGNGMSTKREIESSIQLLPAEKLIGTVLTKAEAEQLDYYYY